MPMPPIDAPNAAINIIAVAKLRLVTSRLAALGQCATIDNPIGNIIAVVAVLLIHIEIPVATARRRAGSGWGCRQPRATTGRRTQFGDQDRG